MIFTKKNTKNIWISIVVVVLVGTFFYMFQKRAHPPYEKRFMIINNDLYELSVADSDKKRIRGLSGTKNLLPNTGMVFIFDREDMQGIWMKEMNYSLDIVWLDSLCQITGLKNAGPDSYPEVFLPIMPSKYVIELPAGSVIDDLKLGDTLDCVNLAKE